MARNRRAALRRLTVEQETVLSSWGNLLSGEPGESDLDTAVRLFGSAEAASAAWYGHRDKLLAADPVPGRRPAGYWLFERGIDPPRVGEEEAELRQLGELTVAEETQLEEWRRMVPEPPQLSIDHSVIDPITPTEDPNDVEALPEAQPEARGGAQEVHRGHSSTERTDARPPRVDGADAPGIPAPEHERTDAPDPPGRPVRGARENDVILPWPRQKGRHPNEGWL